jgi:YD repeat-containing protein
LASGFDHFLTGDFNGDGMADVVRITRVGTTGIYNCTLFLFNGTSFSEKNSFTASPDGITGTIAYVGDFDGDGKEDIYAKREAKLYRYNPASSRFDVSQTYGLNESYWVFCDVHPGNVHIPSAYINRRFHIDFNGNGKTNLLITTPANYEIWELNGLNWEKIISGSNMGSSIDFSSTPNMRLTPGDFNGDGKTDVFVRQHLSTGKEYYLMTSTGTGFERKKLDSNIFGENWNRLESEVFTGDFNGDGKTDIIWNSENGHYLFPLKLNLSTGESFQPVIVYDNLKSDLLDNNSLPWESYLVSRLHFADFSGSGETEMLFDYYPDKFVKKSFIISEPFLVNRIVDGLNRDILFKYALLRNASYSETGSLSATFPVVKHAPLKVVTSIDKGEGRIDNASFARITTNFSYKDLRMHRQGKGFLCFGEMTTSQTNSSWGAGTGEYYSIVATYDWLPAYFMPYLKEEKKYGKSNALISTQTNWMTRKELGGKRIFPYLSSQTFTDNPTDITVKRDNSNYDDYGNPRTVKTTKGGLEETSTITYIQKGCWCPNKISTVSTLRTLNGASQTRSSSCAYDNNGNPTRETVDPTDGLNKVITDYANYEPAGLPRTVTVTANGQTRTWSFTYTPSKRFLRTQTDELGKTTTCDWDEGRGTLTCESDRTGATLYRYDGMNRLVGASYPNGVEESHTLHWATPPDVRKLYYLALRTSGDAPVDVWYNAFDKEVLRETYGFNNQKISVFTKYSAYRQEVSRPTFGSAGSSWIISEQDNFGRTKRTNDGRGYAEYSYNGRTTTVTAPAAVGEKRETTLNAEGMLASARVNNGKQVAFTYYPSGLLKTSTPDGGQTITSEYDRQGNRTRLTDPDAGVIRSAGNGFGQLLWTKQKVHLTGDSILTEYTYKNNGLLEKITRNGEITSYVYDAHNRLSSIEIPGHKQTFGYDHLDRLTGVTELLNMSGNQLTFQSGTTFDQYGRIRRETFPSGYYTENHYDNTGILVEIKDSGNRSVWKLAQGNAAGQVLREQKGAKTTTYGYTAFGTLSSISAPDIMNWTVGRESTFGNINRHSDLLNNQRTSATRKTGY